MFVDLNGGEWTPDPPEVDDAYTMMTTVAAANADESDLAGWLRTRVAFA